jgi:agmatine deiminase
MTGCFAGLVVDKGPASSGFRMPAEWEPQDAVWLSWPLNPDTWPDGLERVQAAVARFAAAITRQEAVRINAAAGDHPFIRRSILASGGRPDRIFLYPHPTNDAWCRDHGPTFLRNPLTGEVAVLDWPYNAWGGKFPPWDLDDQIAARVADALGLRRYRAPRIGEGGGLEVNGAGDLLVTESVWLNPNRNPGFTRAQADAMFIEWLGVDRVHWLPGGLKGDDTDGHVDTLARFVRPDAAVCVVAEDPDDPNFAAMERNRSLLESFRVAGGRPLEVTALPLPAPIRPDGWREDVLPASYANFLILNGAVLVPTYRQPARDTEALEILQRCFPGREVEGIDSFDIVLEGGALHCLSQQQPAAGG